MTKLFARFGGMGFAELQEVDPREFRDFALEFGDVVRSLPFQLPENFLLDRPSDVADVRDVQLARPEVQHLGCHRAVRQSADPRGERQRRAGVREAGRVGRGHRRAAAAAARRTRRRGSKRGACRRRTPARTSRGEPRAQGRRIISAVLFAALFIGGILLRADDVVLGIVLMSVSVTSAAARPVRRRGRTARASALTSRRQSRSPTRSGISKGRCGSHDAGSGHGRDDGRLLSRRRMAASRGVVGAGEASTR